MIGYNPPDGVFETLIHALEKDHHEWVRWQAARSLAMYCNEAAQAEPMLARAVENDSSQYVRDAAAFALEELQKEPEKRSFFGPAFMGGSAEEPTVGFSNVVIIVDGDTGTPPANNGNGGDDEDDDDGEDEDDGEE